MEREPDQLVGLDELFENFSPQPPPRPKITESEPYRAMWWLTRILIAVVAGGAIWGALHALRIGVPYSFVAACVLASAVIRAAIVDAEAEPLPVEVTGKDRQPIAIDRSTGVRSTLLSSGDGLEVAVARWQDRLLWGERDRSRYLAVVAPRLGELIDERLRARHGITRATDPARARRLLGDDVWKILYDPPARGVTPRDVTSVVVKVEEL
jgi:hypothetical protein